MLVYSYLFKERNGYYPQSVVLFFLGELDKEENAACTSHDLLERCSINVEINEQKIKIAMRAFEKTVKEIEDEYLKQYGEQWIPSIYKPPITMCETCDLRWSCSNPNGEYKLSGL